MSRTVIVRTSLLVVLAVVLVACAPGPNDVVQQGTSQPAGFWLGLWQGLITPITFIVSLFNNQVNIYEVYNNGNWYNFGFMLGVSAVFSGTAGSGNAGRRARSRSSGARPT